MSHTTTRIIVAREDGTVVGEYFLGQGEHVIGREEHCVIQIKDAHISREHARLIISENVVEIEDLMSTSGTFLDGVTVKGRIPIQPGQKLWISNLYIDIERQGYGGLVEGSRLGAGRFTLKRQLGSGGMGAVWLALDEEAQYDVALKLVSDQGKCSPGDLEILQREINKAQNLEHPNIVRMGHIWNEDDEPAFISLEYVAGTDLHEVRSQTENGILAWKDVQGYMLQLCDALEYAHSQKVAHRDIKPSNFLVDLQGNLKLADFGIATSLAKTSSIFTSIAVLGTGTPPYMSPQQLDGKRPKVTDDIYSVGATFYELLTSTPPFHHGDIAYQIRHTQATPIEKRLKELELVNDIPEYVGAIVMACLHKDPTQRPKSMREIREWIQTAEAVPPAFGQAEEWILLVAKTMRLVKPIHVIDLAAQRMKGWMPDGAPFCELLNHGREIPDEEQQRNGYTKKILERDGSPPEEVYENFREYTEGLPLVAYKTDDLKNGLHPEWKRMGIEPIGPDGFSGKELAQRLLDPMPTANFNLQTIRQFYRLPERNPNTAMGELESVVDLFTEVLQPMAEKRGLNNWKDITEFTSGLWFPSQLAFGKHKGRFYWEAKRDSELHEWLIWLSESKKKLSSQMGNWYLQQMEFHDDTQEDLFFHSPISTEIPENEDGGEVAAIGPGLIVYSDPEKKQLDAIIDGLRNRLAEVEAEYTLGKMKVDYACSELFKRLKSLYEKRDLLQIQVEYRKRYIDTLSKEGEEEAKQVAEEFEKQKKQNSNEYADAAKVLEGKVQVSKEIQARVQKLWRRLSAIYHPDKHMDDPEKLDIYDKLQKCINKAKERGDVDALEEIEADPEGFIRNQGWGSLDLSQDTDVKKLKDLVASLQARILEMIEALEELEASPDYALHFALEKDNNAFNELVEKQATVVEEAIEQLQTEADELGDEIEELTGQNAITV
jgi:hypothetical protein